MTVRPELVKGLLEGFDSACPEPVEGLSPNGFVI